MTVVGRQLIFSGPSATSKRSGTEWKQTYQYETNDSLDGPQVILDHLRINGPWFGSTYVNGNDADPFSLVDEIDVPQHSPGSATFWTVTLSYKPPTAESSSPAPRPTDSGTYSEIPWYWTYEVSTSVQQVSVPVDYARYRGGFTHVPERVKVGDFIPFTNSSLVEKFDPPLEQDNAHLIIRIKSWHETFDLNQVFRFLNAVNDRKIKFTRMSLPGTFEATTLRLVNIEMSEKREILTIGGVRQRILYYEVIAELHYNPYGWRIMVVDRGTMRGALPHEPNGRGGLITYSTPLGGVSAAKIVDHDGLAVGTPVLLDGAGQPQDWSVLGATVTNPPTVAPNPVYINWQLYDERDLTECDFIGRATISL